MGKTRYIYFDFRYTWIYLTFVMFLRSQSKKRKMSKIICFHLLLIMIENNHELIFQKLFDLSDYMSFSTIIECNLYICRSINWFWSILSTLKLWIIPSWPIFLTLHHSRNCYNYAMSIICVNTSLLFLYWPAQKTRDCLSYYLNDYRKISVKVDIRVKTVLLKNWIP